MLKTLPDWLSDDHQSALLAYELSADTPPDGPPREFFEHNFTLGVPRQTHFTGYFETVLPARLHPDDQFTVPLYGKPDPQTSMPSRAEIHTHGIKAPVLAWLENPLDAFLLQVQGSGKLDLPDGTQLGIGYAGKNGHPYRSIGAELVARGIASTDTMSLDIIRDFCAKNPREIQTLLNINPSYVFFQLRDASTGPIGAMGVPVSPFRSLAIDPDHIPLGTPVWVELSLNAKPLNTLMIAQDIGSAIKGDSRADIFCGTGKAAGMTAGGLNTTGKMIPLLRR